ncbi:hypothetical protein CBR_g39266 [Chara braunii]|uniref:Uncharacterized protein n=1 Tax=Chara braunii TaxID=69332 RepID=A0A388K0Z5_CHABU|nr:hypothetical protein CBR_g39266 [Chara braunii]|eukprot:GBG63724.1 hypothetical protein CBR_g39266 [Chara braunii]
MAHSCGARLFRVCGMLLTAPCEGVASRNEGCISALATWQSCHQHKMGTAGLGRRGKGFYGWQQRTCLVDTKSQRRSTTASCDGGMTICSGGDASDDGLEHCGGAGCSEDVEGQLERERGSRRVGDNSRNYSRRGFAAMAAVLGAMMLKRDGSGVAMAETAVNAAAADGAMATVTECPPETEEEMERMNVLIAVACIVEAVALIGAAVGGWVARQRKAELERINAQLRQINLNLRKQARVETYAPRLSYAPVGRRLDVEAPADKRKEELMSYLRGGKRGLREGRPQDAFYEFEKALALARELKDTVEEKKAARGLGAACQRLGKYKEAVGCHMIVLSISEKTKEHAGDTEAYGSIADCYTELGDYDMAAKYYDWYIGRLTVPDECAP